MRHLDLAIFVKRITQADVVFVGAGFFAAGVEDVILYLIANFDLIIRD